MPRMRYLLILLLCSVALAQDAVVVELPKTDAITAKTLYDAKTAADKAWDQFNSKLTETYKGFYGGIQFSKDFRFIIPHPNNAPSSTLWNGGCTSYTPATGTLTVPSSGALTITH
jgi:hypothetical protein